MTKTISLTLKIWRQKGPNHKGQFETYPAKDISTDMSFLEMLDVVNEQLTLDGKEPIAFDHDCREGICGMCGAVVNGDTIVIEPWRSRAFPVLKDLIVDRSAFDRIIQAGGYISVNTGGAPDANAIPVAQQAAESAMDAAACIGCGACVAACPNAAAMLFTGAKISHLALLPQGKAEAAKRAIAMLRSMDALGFGNCSNERECESQFPKEISIVNIARMNREFIKASFFSSER